MVEFIMLHKKDLGLQREVMDALPYAVVRGTWENSLNSPLPTNADFRTILNYVVPTGHQLKILFMRFWTQNNNGAIFSIVQTNPATAGLIGTTEAFPVVGSVPQGVIDYPMLAAAGAELDGPRPLESPLHVLEGSIDFRLLGPANVGIDKYGFAWWGVVKIPE